MARLLRLLGLGLLLLATACRAPETAPRVVVSIKPVHALAAGVMEGVGEPALLMDGMVSPHSYQMRPSDARLLARADLVVWVAPTVEGTLPATIRALPAGTRTLELITVPGLHLLAAREPGIRAGTGDGDDPSTDEHADHGSADPHVWLDPRNAAVVTDALVAELSALDPANAATYRANGDRQIRRLLALDAELREELASLAGIPFMTFHDAFQYFEDAYGLDHAASIAISPDRLPGARTVMDLRGAIADGNVMCVFAEPQYEPRLVATLVEGTRARTGTLDPLGGEVPAGPPAYEEMMRTLAAGFGACLTPPGSP